jgi:hypothetical protein
LIQEARNGGSITPRFAKTLNKHIQQGRLSLHQHTLVNSQAYSTTTKSWTITTQPAIRSLPEFHHIYFATGSAIDVNSLPFLDNMHSKYPIDSIGGYPQVNDSLMWQDDVPLFVTGKLAALQLGPGAANLEGARFGAERVAWAIEERMPFQGGLSHDVNLGQSSSQYNQDRYIHGVGGKFDSLALHGDV